VQSVKTLMMMCTLVYVICEDPRPVLIVEPSSWAWRLLNQLDDGCGAPDRFIQAAVERNGFSRCFTATG
jgi:hypothetical protein